MSNSLRAPLEKYRQHLVGLDRSPATIDNYMEVLGRMDRHLPYGITHSTADELIEWINSGNRSKATRELYRVIVAGYGRWITTDADEDDQVDFNAAGEIKRIRIKARQPRPIDDVVLGDILGRAAEPYLTWYTIAAYEGARCIEISHLDREDVTEENTILFGKGAKERIVPTHPRVWRAVRDLPDGPVARDSLGRRATRHSIQMRANRHLRILGHAVTMHRLRHWFGTSAYEASGHDILAVKDLLGHENIRTTLGYVAHSQAGRRRAVAGLPVFPTTEGGESAGSPGA